MKIKITNFSGYNPEAFANIKVGTIHNVVRTVKTGWIIKGSNGADVLIMGNEAVEIVDASLALIRERPEASPHLFPAGRSRS